MRIFFLFFSVWIFAISASESPLSPIQPYLNTSPNEGVNTDELPSVNVLLDKGNKLYERKQFNLAIETFDLAVKQLSNNKNIKNQKLLGVTYTKIAQSYKRLKKRKETAFYYKKALTVFTLIKNKKYIARTLNTLAEAERYLGNYEAALDNSLKSLEVHSEIDDALGQAKALMGAAIIYRHIKRYEESLELSYQAYMYFKSEQNTRGLAKASNEMGLLYTHLKKFDQARSFFSKTIALPKNSVDPTTLATALRESAVIECNDKNYLKARQLANSALKIYQATNEFQKQSTVTRIIANIYRDQGNLENAIVYYQQSLSLAEKINKKLYQIKTLIPLGNLLIDLDLEQAITYLKKAEALSDEINNDNFKLYTYGYLRKAKKRQKNYVQSLRYAEKEINLNKIIYSKEVAKQEVLTNANLHAMKLQMELANLKEKDQLNQLELDKKNAEIEIAKKEKTISDLELTKNKYASIALLTLLVASSLIGLLLYRSFITSKKRNEKLNYLANHDPLTGCYNRRYLFNFLNEAFTKPLPTNHFSLIMVDIDHFKTVNDTYGHMMGDKILCSVANILRNTVGSHNIVSRFGGEEFSIILQATPQQQAGEIAELIRSNIENHQENNISVTCSLGISSLTEQTQTPSELIEQADVALFESKSLGRNKVTLWSEKLTR